MSYFIVNGQGTESLEVPKELYDALVEFLQGKKAPGEVLLRFNNGGISEITATQKVVYKGSTKTK